MAELIWAVLCQRATIDRETNQVSLFDLIEELSFPPDFELPSDPSRKIAIMNHLELVTLWKRTSIDIPEISKMQVELLSPGGAKHIVELEITLNPTTSFRGIVRSEGLLFDGFGVYNFRISKQTGSGGWEQVGNVPLEVRKLPTLELAKETPPPRKTRRAKTKKH